MAARPLPVIPREPECVEERKKRKNGVSCCLTRDVTSSWRLPGCPLPSPHLLTLPPSSPGSTAAPRGQRSRQRSLAPRSCSCLKKGKWEKNEEWEVTEKKEKKNNNKSFKKRTLHLTQGLVVCFCVCLCSAGAHQAHAGVVLAKEQTGALRPLPVSTSTTGKPRPPPHGKVALETEE